MAKKITVLGAGSWGTALAQVQAQAGNPVTLWDRNESRLNQIKKTGENQKYHPGIKLAKGIQTEPDLAVALQDADIVILGIPSHAIRKVLSNTAQYLKSNSLIVSAAKGIEIKSLQTVSTTIKDLLGEDQAERRYAVMSGPTFAREVIRSLPAAVTVASFHAGTSQVIQDECQSDTFKILTTDDVIGVEIAGALKNVMAIVAGASDGFEFGFNARAGLITRGLAEIASIGQEKGAHPLTFSGLAGIGDLILTSTGDLSRNRQVGLKLAQGKSLRVIMKELGQVAEGIRTTKAAYRLAESLHVEVPIIEETYFALYEGKPAQQAIRDLIARIPRLERN